MLKMFKYLKIKEWLLALAGLVFILAQVWLDLRVPEYMSEITMLVQTPGSAMRDIWIAGGYMLLCTAGSLTASFLVGFFAARIGAAFSRRMRRLLFEKVEAFSLEEIHRFSTASLITRSTNDITQVEMLITILLQMVVKAPITVIWALTKIIGKGAQWSVTTGIAAVIMCSVILGIILYITPRFARMQVLTDNITRLTRENLQGLRVIRAYNAEKYQEDKFEQGNQELTEVNLAATLTMAVMFPSMSMITNGLSLAIYWIGAVLISEAAMSDRLVLFSNMVVFSSYAMQILMSFMMLTMIFMFLPRATVSARRINEVMETEPVIHYGTQQTGLEGIKGKIEFQNVSFRYPGAEEYVLKDITFTANPGDTVAFIGSTGSGKSTLINLVPRFFDSTEGRILLDGVDVREYSEQALYHKIGYVPQKAVLFKGSVASNIAFGENGNEGFSNEEIEAAAAVAQAADFVESMELGYDTEIAQNGANISGGQKQRLSIARAVCRKPEIYIFDDSFSALDYHTDYILRQELKKKTAGITSLIVAQRIGTIMDADKILVLDQGRIVGNGTHQELIKTCEVYREIAENQLGKEAAAL